MEDVVLITGASGFIGKALVTRLLSESRNIKLILLSRTNLFEEYRSSTQVVPVIGDINNVELLVYVIKTHKVTHIYHLASEAVISEYQKNPRQSYLNTVYGVTSLLEAVRTSGVVLKKILISTSYKVYGRSLPPYNEETHFSPGNTYETAKACQDLIAQDYFRTFNIPVVIFRTVNVYGPGDSNLTRLIPRSFSNVYNNTSPVVYSSVKDSMREFIYIDDLLDAMLLLNKKALPGSIYCVGGQQHSIYDVVKTVCEVTSYNGEIQILDAPSVSETKEHAIDSSKLIELGWARKISLKDGLKKTGEYYKRKLLNF